MSGLESTPAVLMAIRNLDRNRLRSGLAVLGIVIGVIAIATLGIFGNVLQLSATNELGGIGDQVIVSPSTDVGGPRSPPERSTPSDGSPRDGGRRCRC